MVLPLSGHFLSPTKGLSPHTHTVLYIQYTHTHIHIRVDGQVGSVGLCSLIGCCRRNHKIAAMLAHHPGHHHNWAEKNSMMTHTLQRSISHSCSCTHVGKIHWLRANCPFWFLVLNWQMHADILFSTRLSLPVSTTLTLTASLQFASSDSLLFWHINHTHSPSLFCTFTAISFAILAAGTHTEITEHILLKCKIKPKKPTPII